MEKKTQLFKVPYSLEWEYDNEIEKFENDLAELKKLGATHISIEASSSHGVEYLDIYAYCNREETDEEYGARIEKERRQQEEIKRRDLELLESLKKKYGQ